MQWTVGRGCKWEKIRLRGRGEGALRLGMHDECQEATGAAYHPPIREHLPIPQLDPLFVVILTCPWSFDIAKSRNVTCEDMLQMWCSARHLSAQYRTLPG